MFPCRGTSYRVMYGFGMDLSKSGHSYKRMSNAHTKITTHVTYISKMPRISTRTAP